jgi:hypothetical protein
MLYDASRTPSLSESARIISCPCRLHRRRLLRRKNSGIKVQLQAYNVFNEVQFTNMNASFTFTGTNNLVLNSTNTGKYVATGTGLAAGMIQPRTMGLTMRLDW